MIIPGGLGDVVFRVRDAALRWVASRRGLMVPSLVADTRQPDRIRADPELAPSAGGSS
jgi:branched-chain amino acid transport system permease protein